MATVEENESEKQKEKKEGRGVTVHLNVPNPLTRTVSLNDTKAYQLIKKQDDNPESFLTSHSDSDLRRFYLSPKGIRRSASVYDYNKEVVRCPLGVKVNLSDDEVFEFPHTRSPISLKVNIGKH